MNPTNIVSVIENLHRTGQHIKAACSEVRYSYCSWKLTPDCCNLTKTLVAQLVINRPTKAVLFQPFTVFLKLHDYCSCLSEKIIDFQENRRIHISNTLTYE